jgi:hypothetical protein
MNKPVEAVASQCDDGLHYMYCTYMACTATASSRYFPLSIVMKELRSSLHTMSSNEPVELID